MADPDYSILSGFQGKIVRPKTSIFYHAGLVLVAATMLLLPLLYVAIAGAVAYAVYYHATHDFRAITDFNTFGIILFKLLIYFIPLLAGVVMVFFMFKPLLAGRPKSAQPLALNPASERLLYAFIEKICDIVGAPSPRRIDLDCQINAAAHFRRGFLSMFGDDLVLVLGLPLVANLTARELAGVIAHEVGHFSQGAGMRLNYIIGSINFWFERVAYQRDAWDVALERWSQETEEAWVALVVMMVQLAVWFSRFILRILVLVGHIVGAFMQRQQEYAADACQIKVVGSECFEQTMRKLAALDAAWVETRKLLVSSWKRNQTLPDNLPELIRHAHQHLPPPILQKIDDTLGFQRTNLFDSHPSPADRIRQARQANDPGIFHDDRPASSLFASFEHPSRFVTLLHYTDDIGIPICESMLTRVEVERHGAKSGDGSDSYFLGLLPLMKPVRLNKPSLSTKLDADYAELDRLISSLPHLAPQIEGLAQKDAALLDQLTSARTAHILLNNGYALPAGAFSLPKTILESAAAAEAEAIAARRTLRHSLREVLPTLNRRLELAIGLALANVGESATQEGDNRLIAELANWINDNAEIYVQQQQLTEALSTLGKMNEIKASDGENPAMLRALAAAEHTVIALSERLFPQPEPTHTSGGSRLQIAKSSSDFEIIRGQNEDWLRAYDKKLNALVKLVERVENFAAS